MTMWSSTLPLVTCSDAVPVLPVSLPVIVGAPATEAVHVAPVQEPSGAIENVVAEVTSPRLLSYWSRPCAVYVCEPPELIVADAGDSARWSSAPAFTVNEAVFVLPLSLPVTVWDPATVAVQTFPVHVPFGEIEKVVNAVTSPMSLPDASKPPAL